MRRETVTIPAPTGLDWKGVGYLFSIVGALLLGAIAWPKPEDPAWHLPTLLAGDGATIAGFIIRYIAHLHEKHELKQAQAEAERKG